LEEGPDFARYLAKRAYTEAPKLGVHRHAYARILHALDMTKRGTNRNCREKGKQGTPRTVAKFSNAFKPRVALWRGATVARRAVTASQIAEPNRLVSSIDPPCGELSRTLSPKVLTGFSDSPNGACLINDRPNLRIDESFELWDRVPWA
jgi:hypothetical protein